MAETEDVPYSTPDFATPEKDEEPDPDQPNKGILLDCLKYINEQIKKHNSLDVVEPNAEKSVMTTQQQVVVHKEVVIHLRGLRGMIKDKLKELA